MTKEKTTGKKVNKYGLDSQEMMKAGLHLGHKKSRLHPKMKDYIMGVRNTIHIIDLEKTILKIEEAFDYLEDLMKKGETIILVGTKPPLRKIVKEAAEGCDLPYVNERWLGGTFTNFKNILKRIDYFKELERKKNEGELEKYTKKERAEFDKEIRGLRLKFEGLKNLKELPAAIFICDLKRDFLALKEAQAKGIKTISIIDTNVNPELVDYPIPANDDALDAVSYILEKAKEVINKNKVEKKEEKPQKEKKEENKND
jgi:small subunit ribosomal protein S2